jgi:arylsulfatase A
MMIKKLLFVGLLIVGLAAVGLKLALEPLQYGMPEDAFSPGPRDAMVVADVVKPDFSEAAPASKRRPNVVVIFADDLGWGDIGVQGSVAIETPNIDQLARDGIRLSNFYASAPLCSPSRAGLLTGRYPLRSGFSNVLAAADDTATRKLMMSAATGFSKLGVSDMAGGSSPVKGLPPSEITLPEALRVQGYRTLGVGKWHLGDFTHFPEFHPSNQGFEHFFGYNMSNDDWPVALWRDDEELIKDIGIEQESHTREFTEEAVKFIHEWQDQPYFIYLAHKDPHQPFFPSPQFAGKSRGGPYGDAVSEFDWSVGQVVQALRDTGQAENTLLILTSDNGPWFEGSTGGLRGRKGQSYEGGFRVPFIASWPGHIPAGLVSDSPAMNIDVFPTALAVAGLNVPSDRVVDGENLLPLLTGDAVAAERAKSRPLYFFHEFDVEAVRRGQWKYIGSNSHYVWPIPLDKNDLVSGQAANGRDYYPPGSDVGIPTLGTWPLLYNLHSDPSESYNVAKGNVELTNEMGDTLKQWKAGFMANPRGWK